MMKELLHIPQIRALHSQKKSISETRENKNFGKKRLRQGLTPNNLRKMILCFGSLV